MVDINGPRVRLGIAWGAVSFLATIAGRTSTALLFALVAMAAAGQACGTWRSRRQRPLRPVAVLGAALLPVSSLLGPPGLGAAALLVCVAALVGLRLPGLQPRRPGTTTSLASTVSIALVVGLAAAGPVLVRSRFGLVPALVLLAFAHAYDTGSYLVGSGAASRWEGPAAGVAGVAAVSVAVAAVLVPPFRGSSPWVLGGLAAALAPAGPYLATALLGRPRARVPALRRLDALILLGPLWTLAAAAMIDVART